MLAFEGDHIESLVLAMYFSTEFYGTMVVVTSYTPEHKREYKANRFSAGLLVPKSMFVRDVVALGSVDVTHGKTLSDLCQVSWDATANRYAELTADCCGFIFSKGGVIGRPWSVLSAADFARSRA
jgi:hypothetical protein